MLPVLPQIAATSPSSAPAKPAAGEDKGPSFSKVLDDQKNAPRHDAPAKSAQGKPADAKPEQTEQPAQPGKSAEADPPADDAVGSENGSAADTAAADAAPDAQVVAMVQAPVAAPTLPLQALEIAAQSAALQSQSAAKLAAQQTGVAASPAAAATAAVAQQPSSQVRGTPQPAAALPGQAAVAAAVPQAAPLPQHTVVAAAMPVAAEQVQNGQPVTLPRHLTIATARDPRAAAAHAAQAGQQTSAQASLEAPLQAAAMPEATPELPDFGAQLADSGKNGDAPAQFTLGALTASVRGPGAQTPVPAELRPAAPMPLLEVSSPVGSAQWGRDLGRQLVLLGGDAQRGHHTAELRLDPPDLGPLRVTLSLSDGVASASFVSSHAAVRQALESALPQLQQALAEAGISLGQANVGEQGNQFAQEQSTGQQGRGQSASAGDAQGDQVVPQPVAVVRDANALVDTFA